MIWYMLITDKGKISESESFYKSKNALKKAISKYKNRQSLDILVFEGDNRKESLDYKATLNPNTLQDKGF